MEAVAFVIATVYGLFVFYIIIGPGLFRDVSEPALLIGTWLAVVSGGCWYLSAIIPPIWPTRLLLAGVLERQPPRLAHDTLLRKCSSGIRRGQSGRGVCRVAPTALFVSAELRGAAMSSAWRRPVRSD